MPTLAQRYEPAVPIASLVEHPDNPRRGDEAAIDESMAAHGFYGAILAQASTRQIIAGNHRARVARRRGEATVPVLWLDVDDEAARRLLLVDNRANDRAGYERGELARLLEELAGLEAGLAGTGYGEEDLAALLADLEAGADVEEGGAPAPGQPFNRLTDRFIAPPFSVLDGRAGYWRERKRRWLRWGVASAEGRIDGLTSGGLVGALASLHAAAPGELTERDAQIAEGIRLRSSEGRGGNLVSDRGPGSGLQAADRMLREGHAPSLRSGEGRSPNLLSMSDTVRTGGYEGGDAWGWAGTSIFDPVLAELMLRWFCPEAGRVADPFCGGSVRGAVAAALGLGYAGYDLRPEQIAANEAQGAELRLEPMPDWRLGDAREASWDGPFDMLLTCPPYWSLERYSDDPLDLSAAPDLDAFAEGLAACLRPALAALAPDSFAVVVLGAMRQGHRLLDLPGLGARLLEAEGLTLYNDFAFLTPLASAALRAQRIFASRKPVPVHQRVVVAVKGDPLAAVERCGGAIETLADEAVLASWLAEE